MKLKDIKTLIRKIDLADNRGELAICQLNDNRIIIHRYAARGKINNFIDQYEFINKNHVSELKPITLDIAHEIINRAEKGNAYSGIFIFYEEEPTIVEITIREKSNQEHTYTSTGIKFWRHQDAMESYKAGTGHTVISTHISPEGACPLKCPYCSVTYRDTHSRIELDVIKDYVIKLKTRGLKACILTGGGEPTVYHKFNELIEFLRSQDLSIALITNGVTLGHITSDNLQGFSWIRVSVNMFDKWEERIGKNFDPTMLSNDCVIGCSMVYTVEHESTDEIMTDRIELLRKVGKIADRLNAKYIRLLPNCLLEQKDLIVQHDALDNTLSELNDSRFFHQYKIHGTPQCHTCHQSYFRPYLSEEPFHEDEVPGTVYPCDSVVLNNSYQFFAKRYQLCRPGDILDYLDHKIKAKFDPIKDCEGCVFTENVNMLDDWKNNKIDRFNEFQDIIKHEEFI